MLGTVLSIIGFAQRLGGVVKNLYLTVRGSYDAYRVRKFIRMDKDATTSKDSSDLESRFRD